MKRQSPPSPAKRGRVGEGALGGFRSRSCRLPSPLRGVRGPLLQRFQAKPRPFGRGLSLTLACRRCRLGLSSLCRLRRSDIPRRRRPSRLAQYIACPWDRRCAARHVMLAGRAALGRLSGVIRFAFRIPALWEFDGRIEKYLVALLAGRMHFQTLRHGLTEVEDFARLIEALLEKIFEDLPSLGFGGIATAKQAHGAGAADVSGATMTASVRVLKSPRIVGPYAVAVEACGRGASECFPAP